MSRRTFVESVHSGVLTAEGVAENMIDFVNFVNRGIETESIPDVSNLLQTFKRGEKVGPVDQEHRNAVLWGHFHMGGGLGKFERSVKNPQILIHWPTFLSTGFFRAGSAQSKIAWSLQALLRRRSPLLFSLLRRKYLTDFENIVMSEDGPQFTDTENSRAFPLSVDEYALFEALSKNVLSIPELGELMNRAFFSTFISAKVMRSHAYPVLSLWRDSVGKDSALYRETTLVSRALLNELRAVIQGGEVVNIPDAHTSLFGFGTSSWGPLAFDVLCIPHYATTSGKFGVVPMTLGNETSKIKHMVIHLPRFIEAQGRQDKFSKVRWILDKFSNKGPQVVREEVVSALRAQFPKMVENAYRKYAHCEDTWPGAAVGDIYVVPTDMFEQYRKMAQGMASLRAKKTRTGPINRQPGFRQIIQLHSERIVDAGNVMFAFRAVFRDGEVYISPCWEVDFEEEFFRRRNYKTVGEEQRLLPGILFNEASGEYYYSIKLYMTFPETPVSMYSQLCRWLDVFFNDVTKESFKNMWFAAKRLPSYEVHVPRGGNKKAYKASAVFSTEADMLISRYLRPGKLVEVAMMLEKLGIATTTEEIAKRGKFLREQLISEGVFDLDRLPHINYSAVLGKRLYTLRQRYDANFAEKLVKETHKNDQPA